MPRWLLLVGLLLTGPATALAQAEGADDPPAAEEAWDDWEDDDWAEDPWGSARKAPWTGFLEAAYGTRWDEDPAVGRYATLGEVRWRLERDWQFERWSATFRGDAIADAVVDELDANLRELSAFTSVGAVDIRAGRQVLTWGTGDFLFLNDLFPKGWVSFFIGRDDEYLKAPSDAIRVSRFGEAFNVDLVAMPLFNPDEYLTGERLSFFSPAAGAVVAPDPPLGADEPSASLANTEWALRLFRNLEGTELAVYGFYGFYHQPSPIGPGGQLGFPELASLGASMRRPLGPGLFNLEFAQYFSKDDRSGSDPRIPNDQFRFLAGYEWEAATNFTVGLQYYLEWTQDYGALLANSAWPEFEVEERRHWLTTRLTYRTDQDRVTWSLFSFLSPTDQDWYLRPQVSWRISDAWSLAGGGNLFGGDEDYTFFAQFQDDSNVFLRVRFNY